MKVESRDKVISVLKEMVVPNEKVEICLLYGSGAQDNLNDMSDIDIAVSSEKGLSREDCLELSLSLSLKTGREVSVLQIERMQGLILREILSKGIYIKNVNPNYFSRFIIKMYDYSEDLLPFQLKGHQKQIKDFING